MEYIPVPPERAGLELDELLSLLFPEGSKGHWRREVRGGRVLLDGEAVLPSQRVRAEQVLILDLDEVIPATTPVAPPERVPVLYEDDDVLVVDKPAGLAVEPERWARDAASLAGAALEIARETDVEGMGLAYRPRLVHRIDKPTTGVVILAKHLEAERALRQDFEHGRVHKEYLALVEGEFTPGEPRLIEHAIASDPRKGGRMCAHPDGKPSQTLVRVETGYRGYTLVRCQLLTGRTHQIRVHLSTEGFPLAVDSLYGRCDALRLSDIKPRYRAKRGQVERPLIDRLTLHAERVRFERPDGGGPVEVTAELPSDFQRVLKQLAKVRPLAS